MTKKDEYLRQAEFRNWGNYLNELPPNTGGIVLDLGCGLGTASMLLGMKYSHVIAIDADLTFISEAINSSTATNVRFINADLRTIDELALPKVDGIWCSFTAAYFPDFDNVFPRWIRLLKSGGWVALIEVNDLFNHFPLPKDTRDAFVDHYQRMFMKSQYDFMMGSKLKGYIKKYRLDVVKALEMFDPELAFTGQATANVVAAWQDRFNRLTGFKRNVGADRFEKVKSDFLECIQRHDHTCAAKVNFIIARSICE